MANTIISNGRQGPQGEAGVDGDIGPQGITGADGTQGPQGDSGAQGPQGVAGSDGAQGDQGEQGPQGAEGIGLSYGGAISASNIDWSAGNTYYKSISANTTFTFSNTYDGAMINVAITADSLSRNCTFPSGTKMPGGMLTVAVIRNTTTMFSLAQINGVIYCTFAQSLA
jgi:hypothetical protein